MAEIGKSASPAVAPVGLSNINPRSVVYGVNARRLRCVLLDRGFGPVISLDTFSDCHSDRSLPLFTMGGNPRQLAVRAGELFGRCKPPSWALGPSGRLVQERGRSGPRFGIAVLVPDATRSKRIYFYPGHRLRRGGAAERKGLGPTARNEGRTHRPTQGERFMPFLFIPLMRRHPSWSIFCCVASRDQKPDTRN